MSFGLRFCIPLLIAVFILLSVIWIKSQKPVFQNEISSEKVKVSTPVISNINHHRSRRQIDQECSQNFTISSNGGKLVSPNYPNHYPNNLDCLWQLTSSTESKIVLKFINVNLEETENCEYDYIDIYNEKFILLERLCGAINNKILNTNSTTVGIIFHSDASYTDKGFFLEYMMEMTSNCQMILKKDQGVLTSPLYPENYPDETDCRTQIIVSPGYIIHLQFDVLSLEFDANCSYDFVAIYDGITSNSQLLGHFCSNPENSTVLSTNNSILVHFHSDHLLNYHGFSASYKSVLRDNENAGGCKWRKASQNGTITSPNYPHKYPPDANCKFKLQALDDNVITFILDDLTMEMDENCSFDKLEIHNGLTKESPLLGRYCGSLNEQINVTSSGNIAFITFSSDNFAEFSGFKLRYWMHKEGEDIDFKTDKDEPMDITSSTKPPKIKINLKDSWSLDAFIEVPKNSTVIFGQSYVSLCQPKDPTARIRWLKDNQFLGGKSPLPNVSLLNNGTILWIHSMTLDLSGIYTCAAVLPDGVSHSVKALIEMTEQSDKCDIILKRIPNNLTISQGDSDFVTCSPPQSSMNVSWTKNGILITSMDHYEILKNGYLLISEAIPEQSGVYTCIVKDESTGCEKHVSALVTIIKKINVDSICGRPLIGKPAKEKPQVDLGKVVGGHKAEKGAYPWQVILWDSIRHTFCAGSLLNERWVVTAAHCFYKRKVRQPIDKNTVVIKLGKYNQYINEDEEVVTGIQNYILHPAYSRKTHDNDIALIRLYSTISFSDYISPICLGDEQFLASVFSNKSLYMGTITGWGQLKENGPKPVYLQELRMPIVDWNKCVQSTRYPVTKNMYCAGYAQEIIGDACKGDSGGPFIIEQQGIWYLIGIVSWGEGCGREGNYGFYTKVINYHPWIKGIINL